MALPQPSAIVGMKLASAIVHLQEFSSPGGHPFDRLTAENLLDEEEVRAYMDELRALAFLPVRRS